MRYIFEQVRIISKQPVIPCKDIDFLTLKQQTKTVY